MPSLERSSTPALRCQRIPVVCQRQYDIQTALFSHPNDSIQLLQSIRTIVDGKCAVLNQLEPSTVLGNGVHV